MVDGPAFLYDPRPGQQGRLTFQGAAGQDLQLQWDDTTWSPDYSPVTVTNPDGSELTELSVPQTGHSAGMAYLPTLPATGTYVLDVGICCGQVTYWPVALATQNCTPPLPVVEPSSTTITSITPNPVSLGASYTIVADVKTCSGANPPGTVTVSEMGGTGGSCTIDTTMATSCSIQSTVGGARGVIAEFHSQDGSVAGSKGASTVNVEQAQSTVSIGNVAPEVTSIGQTYVVNVHVLPQSAGAPLPTGTVLISNGNNTCTVVLPATTCALASSSAGVATITGTYSGDSRYAGNTSGRVFHPVSGSGGVPTNGSENTVGLIPMYRLQVGPGLPPWSK